MPTKAKSKPEKPAAGWRVSRSGGLQVLRSDALHKLPWLVHGFSTRPAGESSLDGARVLNLGYTDWDTREAVLANRKLFFAAVGAGDMRFIGLRQIHSDCAHVVGAAHGEAPAAQGDALITREPGALLAVQTADCIPILLADARQRIVAAVHAGWRGTLARIAAKTIGRMQMEFGTRPRDVHAALGPGIKQCCYEVGIEVAQKFNAQFENAARWFEGPFERLLTDDSPNPLQWLNRMPPGHQPPPPTVKLDLHAANRAQLIDTGVPAAQISVTDLCTACRTDLLFSHRAEHGRTGRLMAVIGIS